MREFTADPNLLVMALPCRPGRTGIVIVEPDALMHIVADRLHPCPSPLNTAKKTPRCVRELVGVTVPAAEKIDENIIRKLLDGRLRRVWNHQIGHARVLDQKIRRDFEPPCWRQHAGADVAEPVTALPVL